MHPTLLHMFNSQRQHVTCCQIHEIIFILLSCNACKKKRRIKLFAVAAVSRQENVSAYNY
jgi:hypothetical protein